MTTPRQQSTARQAFYEQVWAVVRTIPSGQVATYGQIAKQVTPPANTTPQEYKATGARLVGNALAACPADVPWQRVINAKGKVSDRPGALLQRDRLEQEGIVFVGNQLDLSRYQWRSPNEPDTPRQARLF